MVIALTPERLLLMIIFLVVVGIVAISLSILRRKKRKILKNAFRGEYDILLARRQSLSEMIQDCSKTLKQLSAKNPARVLAAQWAKYDEIVKFWDSKKNEISDLMVPYTTDGLSIEDLEAGLSAAQSLNQSADEHVFRLVDIRGFGSKIERAKEHVEALLFRMPIGLSECQDLLNALDEDASRLRERADLLKAEFARLEGEYYDRHLENQRNWFIMSVDLDRLEMNLRLLIDEIKTL